MFADWTDRIDRGEVPPAPPRPQGVERNVVITQWDWADPKAYLHDVVSTDRRNPTLNANGLIYGSLELSADYMPVLDPMRHTISQVKLTVRDPNTPPTSPTMPAPSPYWGEEAIWTSKNNVHNPMLDEKGRLWLTSAVRPAPNPDFCKEGSSHPSAKLYPIANAGRQLAVYDPATKQITHINTCFGTHHLMFAEDANHTLWTSGGGQVVGWLNTQDVRRDGRRGEVAGLDGAHHGHQRQRQARRVCRAEPAGRSREGQAIRRGVLLRLAGAGWIGLGNGARFPGRGRAARCLDRIRRRRRSPKSTSRRSTIRSAAGYSPRGGDVDRNGVVLGGAGERSPGQLRSPQVQGPAQRSEGNRPALPRRLDALYGAAAAVQRRHRGGSAEASYYTWVDWHDTLGLGENMPINTGNASEGLLALKDGKWVVLRIPYPTGFYTKWMDGRIDDREGRMEGPRAVGDDQHANAVPHGDGQGHDEQGDALPAASGSAGEMTAVRLRRAHHEGAKITEEARKRPRLTHHRIVIF